MSEGKTNRKASLTAKSLKNQGGQGKALHCGATWGDALTPGHDKDSARKPSSPILCTTSPPGSRDVICLVFSPVHSTPETHSAWLFTKALGLHPKGLRRTVLGENSGPVSCLTVPLLTAPQQLLKSEDPALPAGWQPGPQAAKTLLLKTL